LAYQTKQKRRLIITNENQQTKYLKSNPHAGLFHLRKNRNPFIIYKIVGVQALKLDPALLSMFPHLILFFYIQPLYSLRVKSSTHRIGPTPSNGNENLKKKKFHAVYIVDLSSQSGRSIKYLLG
jgi:hypothetical protein